MARAMKDSGIEWIGEIPEGWECKKLKFCSQFVQQKYDDKSDISLSYIGLENVVSWNGKYIETDSQYDKEQSVIFQRGDILWGKLRPYLAKVYHAKSDGCCSGEFCVIRIGRQYSDRYFWNLLISSEFVSTVDRSTYGTKMPRANADFIKNVVVPVPPINEQSLIADFLDAECARIDAVIEQTRASIEEYRKLKQSVITQAVTKGIRSGRKMKDSGVEWIGEIPEEWTVSTILSHITFEGGSQPPLTQFIHEPREGYVRLIQNRDYKTDAYITYVPVRSVSKFCEEDDVMIGRYGPPVFVLHRGIKGAYNVALMKAVPVDIDREFMAYVLQEYTLIKYVESFSKRAAGQDGVNPQILKKYPLCLPTRDEQIEIVTFLNEKCSDIDSIIAGKENLIDCLEQYKKSLVFEYVTGKKEVPA